MKLEELQATMATALANNDIPAMESIASEIVKGKAERHKAEADAAVKEAEALAGKREELEAAIKKAVKTLNLDESLAKVKAKGFTFTTDHREDDKGRIDPSGSVSVKGGVGLLVTAVKVRKAGTGGGAGKSKDEYGLTLSEIVTKFGTADELAAIDAADSNSRSWQLKVVVKKRVIKEGLLAPAR